MKSVGEIRDSFTDYFQKNSHQILESASLFPAYDPTLLFTTAGMVPFKSYFSGISTPPYSKIATIQKCMRTTDLMEVGKTKRHLSFFEMLGNFSFGDYFKKEAIEFAWDYSTQKLNFPKENIWVTIYLDDDTAFSLWKNHIGVDENKIYRLGKKDNFWGPAGNTGACGPSSELYLDRGVEYDSTGKCCKPGDSGERFMEFWNLVFNQFHKSESGKHLPLSNLGIDTGAGLERIASLVQGVDNIFETNELALICQEVCSLYAVEYKEINKVAVHILSDHIRALCFSIADGIFPSNESRGYVLRRILRRAMLYRMKLEKNQVLLHKIAKKVIDIYGKFYPELQAQKTNIQNYIFDEENRFMQTLSLGSEKLEEIVAIAQKKGCIKGQDAFLLYDTYGFPLEMTIEIAEQKELEVDINGFKEEMEKQRQKGRLVWKKEMDQLPLEGLPFTQFTGYENFEEKTKILRIIYKRKEIKNLSENKIKSGENFYIIMEKSPFYAEGGGQLGDQGNITGINLRATISDTKKVDELILHICEKLEGEIKKGDCIHMKVDQKRRASLCKNHSATHLLNASLQKKLGNHIRQTGSLVHNNYLRFDFSHPKALTLSEIEFIENDINQIISKAHPISTSILPKKEAEKQGAVMTFGEKYGEIVRIIKIGNASKDISIEFCGGTHVKNTAEIGSFLIIKESSPGAGNRRIEAVSAERASIMVKSDIINNDDELNELEDMVYSQTKFFKNDAKELLSCLITLKKKMLNIKKTSNNSSDINYSIIDTWQKARMAKFQIEDLSIKIRKKIKKEKLKLNSLSPIEIQKILSYPKENNGICYYNFLKEGWDISSLQLAADSLREKNNKGIYILNSFIVKIDKSLKWSLVLAASRVFTQKHKLDLGQTVKSALKEVSLFKGGGGGSITMAQASGQVSKDIEPIQFYRILSEKLICKL